MGNLVVFDKYTTILKLVVLNFVETEINNQIIGINLESQTFASIIDKILELSHHVTEYPLPSFNAVFETLKS